MNIPFEQIWNKVIRPLEGKIVYTLDKASPNMIAKITNDSLTRNSNNTSKPQPISKQIFEVVYNQVMENGSISRIEINKAMPKRFSSIVCAVLAKAPNIRFELNPIKLYKK